MAQENWTELSESIGSGSVRRGVTAGFVPPAGGAAFVYGFHSVDLVQGAVGLFTNQADFAPTAKGGTVRGCIQRAPGAGSTGFAPMLFFCLQGSSVGNVGYLLGLADGEPAHILLRKGVLASGLPDVQPDPPANGVLRRSTATVVKGTWVHLRLDVVVNANGDVRLQVFQNDLAAHPLSGAASWVAIPGMTEFVDDSLGVNSGSAPLLSGRAGYGFQVQDVGRRALGAAFEVWRQT